MSQPFEYRFFGFYRFALAFFVLLSHFQEGLLPSWPGLQFSPAAGVAVHVFFVLSGFVIAEALDIFYRNREWAFVKNRALRIFPPFLLAYVLALLSIVVLAHLKLPHPNSIFRYDLALQPNILAENLLSIFDFHIPQARETYPLMVRTVWTLVIEWQFYMTIALIFFLLGRGNKLANAPRLLVVTAILSYVMVSSISPHLHQWFYKTILHYFIYFVVGMLLYWRSLRTQSTTENLAAGVCFAIILGDYFSQTHGISTVFFGIGCLAISWLAQYHPAPRRAQQLHRLDRFFGDLSYPLFLNHYTVQLWFYGYSQERNMLIALIGIAAAIGVAWLAGMATESVTERWRNRIRGQSLVPEPALTA